LDEKILDFEGLDGRGMKVDDEIVSRGSRYLLSSDGTTHAIEDFQTGVS